MEDVLVSAGGQTPRPRPRLFRPARRGNPHFAYSPRLLREMILDSRLELEAGRLIEFDPEVEDQCEQPDLSVGAWLDGIYYESWPDFWLRLRNGTNVIVEVKYDRDLKDPESRAHQQIRVQKEWCAANRYTHLVLLESDIWKNPTLQNSLRVLLPKFGADYPVKIQPVQAFLKPLLEIVGRRPGLRFHDLEGAIGATTDTGALRLLLYDLVRKHVVDAGIERIVFNPNSPIFPGPEFKR